MRSKLLTPPTVSFPRQTGTADVVTRPAPPTTEQPFRRQGDVFVTRTPAAPASANPPWFERHRYAAFRQNGTRPEPIPLAEALPAFGVTTYLDVGHRWMGLERPRYVEQFIRKPLIGTLNLYQTLGISGFPLLLRCRMFNIEYDTREIPFVIPNIVPHARSRIAQLSNAWDRIPNALLRFGRVVFLLPGRPPYFSPDDAAEYRSGGLITLADDQRITAGLYIHELAHGILTDTPAPYQRRLKAAIRFAVAADESCGPTVHAESDEEEAFCEGFRYFNEAGPAMRQLIINVMTEATWRPQIITSHLGQILKIS